MVGACSKAKSSGSEKGVGGRNETLPGYLRADHRVISSARGGVLDVEDARITFGPSSARFDFDGSLTTGQFPILVPGAVIARPQERAISVTGSLNSTPMTSDDIQRTFVTVMYLNGVDRGNLKVIASSIDAEPYAGGAVIPSQYVSIREDEGKTIVTFSSRLMGFWLQVVGGDIDPSVPVVAASLLSDLSNDGSSSGLQLAAINRSSCVLTLTGEVRCWGEGGNGQLGNGANAIVGNTPDNLPSAFSAIDFGTTAPVKSICGGEGFFCALVNDGQIKCWGRNSAGQLAQGDSDNRGATPATTPDQFAFINLGTDVLATDITCGAYHACAIVNERSDIKCWGSGNAGQLGRDMDDSVGDEGHELGDAVVSVPIGSADTRWRSVNAGADSTCAISEANRLYCWGDGQFGKVHTDGQNVGDGYGAAMNNIQPIFGPDRVVSQVAVGAHHVCAIVDDDELFCWGANYYGELGFSTGGQAFGDSQSERDNMTAVSFFTSAKPKRVFAGMYVTCIISTSDDFKCWGHNQYGKLGQGNETHVGSNTGEVDSLPFVNIGSGRKVMNAAVGFAHICVALDNHKVKCWGDRVRELGHGIDLFSSIGDSQTEMGDGLPYTEF